MSICLGTINNQFHTLTLTHRKILFSKLFLTFTNNILLSFDITNFQRTKYSCIATYLDINWLLESNSLLGPMLVVIEIISRIRECVANLIPVLLGHKIDKDLIQGHSKQKMFLS